MKIKRAIVLAYMLASLNLLSGCSITSLGHDELNQKLNIMKGSNRSLIYGHIDMSDAKSDLRWVRFKRAGDKSDDNIIYSRISDGTFYLENLKPGTYVAYDFGGKAGGFFSYWHIYMTFPITYYLPKEAQFMKVEIKKPGAYYLGSYKYVEVETGFFEKEKYDIKKVNTPSKNALRMKLAKFAGNTRWAQLLN